MKYEDLKILAELREKGALTEEEYQRKSKNIERRQKTDASGSFENPYLGWMRRHILRLCIFRSLRDFGALIGFIIPLSCGLPIKMLILRLIGTAKT